MNTRIGWVCALAAGFAGHGQAAETPLGNLIEDAGGSELLVATGEGVQQTCGQLAPMFDPLATGDPGSPAEDLFFRCTEMVQTALALLGASDLATANSLGLSVEQLGEVLQQLTGEEQSSKTRLATETSNGQFANIGMRLDAIRRGARATSGMGLAMRDGTLIGGNAGEGGPGSNWGWFANGAVGFGERDATDLEDEYEYDAYGATLGVGASLIGDITIGGNATVGAGSTVVEDVAPNTTVAGVPADPIDQGTATIEAPVAGEDDD